MTEPRFHLVIIYCAAENTYSLAAHNHPPDKAKSLVDDFNQHMQPGFTLMTIKQRRSHKTEDAQNCRACRETVRLFSGLQPAPRFVRRKQ